MSAPITGAGVRGIEDEVTSSRIAVKGGEASLKKEVNVILGRQQLPSLKIPGELFAYYQPLLGGLAILVWLNLRWLVEVGGTDSTEQILQQQLDITPEQLSSLLQQLCQSGLLEITDSGQYVVNEPLPKPILAKGVAVTSDLPAIEMAATVDDETTAKVASSSTETAPPVNARQALARGKDASAAPAASDSVPAEMTVPPTAAEKRAVITRRPRRRATDKARNDEGRDQLSADMQAVMQIYEKKMGVVGSSHFQKLRFWVEDMGMEGEVVAAAIEEAARNNSTRRMSYIEGILRNWHNEGILTLRDLLKGNASRVLASQTQTPAEISMEGIANAEAYKRVDPSMVKKWKELYPDEYDS